MHMRSSNGLSALLMQVSDATSEAIRAEVDLSERELAALVLIRNRSGCSASWLHERLGLTQSGAVRLLERLEGLGLVRRARATGRREVSLAVTSDGEAVVSRGVDVRAQAIDSQLAGLSAAERDAFMSLAERALASRNRSRDEGDEACRLCDWRLCTPGCPVDDSVCRPDTAAAPVPDAP